MASGLVSLWPLTTDHWPLFAAPRRFFPLTFSAEKIEFVGETTRQSRME
jgi:hypothetical protein